MKRPVKIVVVVVLLIVLGLVVVPMLFLSGGGSYRRAVEAYKRDLTAKGEELAFVKLVPASSRDPELARRFTNMISAYQRPTNPAALMRMVMPGVAAVGSANLTPAQMLSYGRNVTNVSTLREIIGTNVLTFKSDYSEGVTHSPGPVLYLSRLRTAEVLASETLTQALASHDHRQALTDLFLAVDLPRLYHTDPTLICDLVRNAMTGDALRATWEALQSGQWSDPELAELQAKWQDLTEFQNMGQVLRGERAFGIAAIAELRRTNEFDDSLISPLPVSSSSSGDDGWLSGLRDKLKELYNRYPAYWKWRDAWSYDQELFMLQTDEAVLECVEQAQKTEAAVPALRELDRQSSRIGLLHAATTNHFKDFFDLPEELTNWLHRAAELETAQRITITAIALKRYQLAHNAYPATLSELVPQYLAEVPKDFMDGKPLRYKLQPDGNFLLYSVGADGEDNGGDPTPTTVNNWLKGRDIVWPRAATQQEIQEYEAKSKRPVRALNR